MDLISRMHDSAMCVAAGQQAAAAASSFYSYSAGKTSPAQGTSCSSGDEESCGSGGSLRMSTEALRCHYGEKLLTGSAAAAPGDQQQTHHGLASSHEALASLGRRTDTAGDDDRADVSADYDDDDDDNDRQRQHSSLHAPGTHRKHKAQKQVIICNENVA